MTNEAKQQTADTFSIESARAFFRQTCMDTDFPSYEVRPMASKLLSTMRELEVLNAEITNQAMEISRLRGIVMAHEKNGSEI